MGNTKRGEGKVAVNTVVGQGTVLEGCFEVQEGVRVDGILRGRLTASGTLVVGPAGEVKADLVKVSDALIAGRFEGKLEALNQVRLDSSAVLVGDVTARVLIIEEGAEFRGFCDAGGPADAEIVEPSPEQHPEEAKKAVG